MQRSTLRRAPAAFAGDDFKIVGAANGAHDDRLNDAALADRIRQIGKFSFGKCLARVTRVGAHMLNRHASLIAISGAAIIRCVLGTNITDQRCQAPAKPRT
jgi:hypothetical protein